jgi:2-haloacid dehalogenase
MRYRWLLFDADGTLFDYVAAERQALARTFAQAGLSFDDEILTAYQQINARLWKALELGELTPAQIKVRRFGELFAALDLADFVTTVALRDPEAFSARYLMNLGDCTDLIPGARSLLERLEGKVRLALITNGLKDVQRSRLAKSGLDCYFEAVVISDEVGVSKPEPGIFDIAFDRMDQPAKGDVLMIGDSLTSDMRGAIRYGIDACWFNPEAHPRDPSIDVRYEIRYFEELLPLLHTASPL